MFNVCIVCCSVIEFRDLETAALAIEKMHRHEIKDRKLVVREVSLWFLSIFTNAYDFICILSKF